MVAGALLVPADEDLTVDNYYVPFVPQVTAAREFFTWMSTAMIAAAAVMTVSEWHHQRCAVIVLGGVIAATTLTGVAILALAKVMAGHPRS